MPVKRLYHAVGGDETRTQCGLCGSILENKMALLMPHAQRHGDQVQRTDLGFFIAEPARSQALS